jgi:hypothetical protein
MENPEPTETEQELQGTQRHQDEEAMRGVGQDDDLPVGSDVQVDDEGGRPDDDRD